MSRKPLKDDSVFGRGQVFAYHSHRGQGLRGATLYSYLATQQSAHCLTLMRMRVYIVPPYLQSIGGHRPIWPLTPRKSTPNKFVALLLLDCCSRPVNPVEQ